MWPFILAIVIIVIFTIKEYRRIKALGNYKPQTVARCPSCRKLVPCTKITMFGKCVYCLPTNKPKKSQTIGKPIVKVANIKED